MISVVASECNPEAIILFGSYVTGTANPDSDVDLLVILRQTFDDGSDRHKEMVRIWRALAHFPIAKDILVYSREELERWRGSQNHIIARALREGKGRFYMEAYEEAHHLLTAVGKYLR
jgi:predicted nucleotidyltransferase